MRAILRSIALIDGTFTAVCNNQLIRKTHGTHISSYSQDANKRRMQAAVQPQQKPPTLQLKRKIGYETEMNFEKESYKQKKPADHDSRDMIMETLD